MECFCGCERSVPRFPLGLRSVNKRGTIISRDLATVQTLLNTGMRSPNAEAFVIEGYELQAVIAEGIHSRTDPGPEAEAATRRFMRRSRSVEGRLGKAVSKAGMDEKEAIDAIARGDFDPFKDPL